MLLFDLESNGLLPELTRIHCLVIKDVETKQVFKFVNDGLGKDNIETGVRMLMTEANSGLGIGGHNIISFDIPAIKKLFPWFEVNRQKVFDTLVCSRLIWTDIKDRDAGLLRKGKLPGKLFGTHKLEAWGYRLGVLKGEYGKQEDAWAKYSDEMLEYCVQDVEVTHVLYDKILSKQYSPLAIELEHQVMWLMAQMMRNGYHFDVESAKNLYAQLSASRYELEQKLREAFGWWWQQDGKVFVPKSGNLKNNYTAGCPVTKIKQVWFNPSSRKHIANRLTKLYGWEPQEFTESGEPKVDEDTLKDLKFPNCDLLVEYLMINKRIGQLAEGDQAWLKCEREGFIYGSINPNGAVTGRATHSFPNIGQVPAVDKPYGPECRGLFGPPPGWVQVGADASGLELRCLGHFMAPYDNGDYIKLVTTGDVHTANQNAAGLPTRNNAKTFIYAFLYGAGDEKIGSIVGKGAKEGKRLKLKFLANTPALAHLKDAVAAKVKKTKTLRGLDGRILHVRSDHSALNTLLQSAGALLCKKWIVLWEEAMLSLGYKHGWDGDFALMAWVHDEIQVACRTPEIAEVVAKVAVECVAKAGEFFNFRCPLTGEAKTGANWAECH